MLCKLFETLYDEEIVSEDTFLKWVTSNDPAEQKGKEVARMATAPFIDWLRSPTDEIESDS